MSVYGSAHCLAAAAPLAVQRPKPAPNSNIVNRPFAAATASRKSIHSKYSSLNGGYGGASYRSCGCGANHVKKAVLNLVPRKSVSYPAGTFPLHRRKFWNASSCLALVLKVKSDV